MHPALQLVVTMKFTFGYLLNSLSGWDLTSYICRMLISDDFHFTAKLFPAVISLFPLSFRRVRFLAFLSGRPHGLMLIHENGRLSIKHSLAGGLRDIFSSCQGQQRRVDRQAIAAHDSGCQGVHQKWENQRKLSRC